MIEAFGPGVCDCREAYSDLHKDKHTYDTISSYLHMNRESDTNNKQLAKIVNLELAGSQEHLGKR